MINIRKPNKQLSTIIRPATEQELINYEKLKLNKVKIQNNNKINSSFILKEMYK